jgi:SPP1 gp7 family putative phage head morphogenesis protein
VKIRLSGSRKRQEKFIQQWRGKYITAFERYWKRMARTASYDEVDNWVRTGVISAEYKEMLKDEAKKFSNSEIKPLLHTQVDEQGIRTRAEIARVMRKGIVAMLTKRSQFDAARQSVIDFLDQENIYWEVDSVSSQINALHNLLRSELSQDHSIQQIQKAIKRIFGLTELSAGYVSRYVDSLLADGMDAMKAERLGDRYAAQLHRLRAETIARTESTRAYNFANMEAVDQGIEGGMADSAVKIWSAIGDERTRDSHAAIDGEGQLIDGMFSIGVEYPGDPNGAPEETINCRCTLLYELEG